MVERSIAWLVRGGQPQSPLPRHRDNDLWLHHRLAGLNLRRLLNLGSPAARSLGAGLTVRRAPQTSRPGPAHRPLTPTSALGSITTGGVTSGRSLDQTACSSTAARRPAPQAPSSGGS
jgi:hypothetical protein